jgi:Concanavalin A-like lectin/glucanases superfamily
MIFWFKKISCIAVLFSLALSLNAAVITWSSATNIVADTDIYTNGNFEYGGYFTTNTAALTVNGVTFTGSGGSHSFGANFSASFASGGSYYSGMGAGTGLSPNYQTLLGGCVYGGNTLNSITLNNLKIGCQYFVQIWINDSRNNGIGRSNTITSGNSVTLDYNNTDAVGGRGQFAVGTFIADYPSLTFYLQSNQSGQFNALQLRSLPATAQTLALVTNVTVSIVATQKVRTVDARLFGMNTAIYDANLQGPSSVPLLFEENNQVLRWPGGSYGDSFLLSTEPSRPSWEPRTTNFLYIAKHTGAQIFMIANYGSGQPSDAADWVRSVNITNTAGAKYWEIGNEIFGSWEIDNNTNAPYTAHDPWSYAQRFAQYYSQMKAVDPTIKIGAVGVPNETSSATTNLAHGAYNPRTGVTNYGWMPVVLATLKTLGVTPDFLVYHNYAGSGDAALLQWSTVLTRDGTNFQQMLSDYISPAAATNVELCITEVGPSGSDQSSTSLVGGLFLADNTGQALLSPFTTRLWWSFRNGGSAVAANTNIYGWRNFQDYGTVPTINSTALTNRYPTYYCAKLMQFFARGGDAVVAVSNSSPLLTTYAVKQQSGALALLVINKSPSPMVNGTFNLTGFAAATNVTMYSYGIPQDETVRTNGTLSPDIAVTNFFNASPASVNYTFAPYSANVLVLGNLDPSITTKISRTRITFTNYTRSEVLTNFPALVVLNTNLSGFNYASFASPTAGDLRFKSADGLTDLNYEIETWNPRGNSYVWVQVPRLTNNAVILAQWGGTQTIPPACTTNGAVWTNGFVGVWHLNGLTAFDSAQTNDAVIDGTPTVVGCVGNGATFNNTTNDSIRFLWSPMFDVPTNFEISGWFKEQPTDTADYRTLVNKESSLGSSDRNWWIATRADGKLEWKSSVSSGTAIDLTNTASICDGAWHQFSAVHYGSVAKLFLDGLPVSSLSSPGTASTQNAMVEFGEEYGGGRLFLGQLDEMRISKISRSTNWIWASYQTVASNSVFSSASAVSTIGLYGTNLTAAVFGNALQLSWPTDHTGWRLQAQTNSLLKGLGTNWTDVPSAPVTNQITLPANQSNGGVFYRMVFP